MPLVKFYTSDPGGDVLVANTQINIIEQLNQAFRYANGRGVVLMVGAVVNDRGVVDTPTVLTNGVSDLKRQYGGFKPWLGDEVALGALATGYDTKGSISGYNGNLYALTKGLDAPVVVLSVPDLAVKDATLATGVDLRISMTRSTAANGAVTVPAGTRIRATSYMVATLEDVSWTAAETGAKTVRFRQVSPSSVTPVDISTITTFVGEAAGGTATTYAGDVNITVNTVATTVPDPIDAAELLLRYTACFAAVTSHAAGVAVDVVCCDRTEATITDALAAHCESASLLGYFRTGAVAPPLATTAADAEGSTGVGVGRATLKDTYVTYQHPGHVIQFAEDANNLTGPDYTATMPDTCTFAFLMANTRPEENPANPHRILENRKIVGIEALATAPGRAAHETAGICQPVIEASFGSNGVAASYHAGVMANGTTKIATRRMAFFLYRNMLAISQGYHKRLASLANRQGFLSAIDSFLERLKAEGPIADFTEPVGTWDGETSQFTVSVTVTETGNMDVITLRPVFGPASATTAAAA
jgi:hypothetical protein